MARGTTTYTQAYGSVTVYKNSYQPLSTILNQASPRTADTGQVNWAAVATESTVIRDFEIFALGGSLQATAPVFIRIDYIGGNATGGVQVTVGTTTDGAGNLGGLTVPLLDLQVAAIGTPPPQQAWAASDQQSYFTFLYALEPNAAGSDGVGMFVVERTRDLNGDPTAAGFHVWRWVANTTAATAGFGDQYRIFGAGSQPSFADFTYGVFAPDFYNATTGLVDATTYCWPASTYVPLTPGGASKALMFGFSGDFPRGQAITVNHYGQAMSFVTLGDAVATAMPMMTSATVVAQKTLMPMIRWD